MRVKEDQCHGVVRRVQDLLLVCVGEAARTFVRCDPIRAGVGFLKNFPFRVEVEVKFCTWPLVPSTVVVRVEEAVLVPNW